MERTMKLPNTEKEFQELAENILSSYEDYYYVKEDNDIQRFRDAEYESRGLQTSTQGVISFLLLSSAFGIKLNERCSTLVHDELTFIIKTVSSNGYNLTPRYNVKKAKEFKNNSGGLYSIETTSLVLSTAILAKWTLSQKLIELPTDVVTKLKDTAIESLCLLCDSQHSNGGWSFAGIHGSDSIKEPIGVADLYNTYTASETLADLGDYVLGETDGIDPDPDLKEWFDQKLLEKADHARQEAANWLINLYVVDPEATTSLGICPIQPPSTDNNELLPGGKLAIPPYQSNGQQNFDSIYRTLYVIDTLIVNGADERFQENAQAVRSAIAHGIYLNRIQLDHAFTNKDYWNDAEKSKLIVRLEGGNITKEKNLSLEDQNLLPLALRCNALYCYYISEGPDSFMELWMQRLLDSRDKQSGLWDDIGVSVAITEKSIEAIIDYYDYFKKLKETSGDSATLSSKDTQPRTDDEITLAIRNIIKSELSKLDQNIPLQKQDADHQSANNISLNEITNMFIDLSKQMDNGKGCYKDEEILSFSTSLRSLILSVVGMGFEEDDNNFKWRNNQRRLKTDMIHAKETFRYFIDEDDGYSISKLIDFLYKGVGTDQNKQGK